MDYSPHSDAIKPYLMVFLLIDKEINIVFGIIDTTRKLQETVQCISTLIPYKMLWEYLHPYSSR